MMLCILDLYLDLVLKSIVSLVGQPTILSTLIILVFITVSVQRFVVVITITCQLGCARYLLNILLYGDNQKV